MCLSVQRLPSLWVYAACVFVSVCSSCRKGGPVKFSGNVSFGSPQLFDSCFLTHILFTVEMTLLALAPVFNADIGWPF